MSCYPFVTLFPKAFVVIRHSSSPFSWLLFASAVSSTASAQTAHVSSDITFVLDDLVPNDDDADEEVTQATGYPTSVAGRPRNKSKNVRRTGQSTVALDHLFHLPPSSFILFPNAQRRGCPGVLFPHTFLTTLSQPFANVLPASLA